MSLDQIKSKVDMLGRAWEEFKHINDRRLDELEQQGTSDVLTDGALGRINDELDECKSRIDKLYTQKNRPALGDLYESDYELERDKKFFADYIRHGVVNGYQKKSSSASPRSISYGSSSSASLLLAHRISAVIYKQLYNRSLMRKLAHVESTSRIVNEVVVNKTFQAKWLTSTLNGVDTAATITDAGEFVANTVHIYTLYARPVVTQLMLDDSSMDIAEWIIEKITEVFSEEEEKVFISGSSSAGPVGLFKGSIVSTVVGASTPNGIVMDDMIQLVYSLPKENPADLSIISHPSAVYYLRLMKDSTGRYIWNYDSGNERSHGSIYGIPLYMSQYAPLIETGSLPVAIANLKKAYWIMDYKDMTVLRDPYTSPANVSFLATKGVGADVVDGDVMRYLRTQGPPIVKKIT